MKITRGYKTQLDPSVKQQILLCQCAGTARFAYNYGLARKQEVSKESGKFISAIDLQKELTARKHTDLPWLQGVSKWIVQNALRGLDQAYDNFFRRVRERKAGKKHQSLGLPQLKSKSQGRGSFRLDKPIHVFDDRIQLPKLGTLHLKERNYLPTSGVKVLSATVSERAGKWFVSVLVEEEVRHPIKASGQPIGVDLGVSTLASQTFVRMPSTKQPVPLSMLRLPAVSASASRPTWPLFCPCRKPKRSRRRPRNRSRNVSIRPQQSMHPC